MCRSTSLRGAWPATRITGHDALHAMQLALEFIERALISDDKRQFFFLPDAGEPPEPYEPTL